MKKVLITGVSRGIGKATANALVNQGYSVTGTSRAPESIDICDPLFNAIKLDLAEIATNADALQAVVGQCTDVNVLILNAGQGRFGGLEEFSYAQIERLMMINLIAQIQLVRAFISEFKKHSCGDVIFIGSESALAAGKQGTIYSAAKFGIRGFSQALRRECAGNNIRVGLINPGMVRTSFFDELGFEPGPDKSNSLLPEQVAQTVLFMLNNENNLVFDEINLSPMKKVIQKKKS